MTQFEYMAELAKEITVALASKGVPFTEVTVNASLIKKIAQNVADEVYKECRPETPYDEIVNMLNTDLSSLNLSVRLKDIFELLDFRILADVVCYPRRYFSTVPGCGRKTYDEITKLVVSRPGLYFGMYPQDYGFSMRISSKGAFPKKFDKRWEMMIDKRWEMIPDPCVRENMEPEKDGTFYEDNRG